MKERYPSIKRLTLAGLMAVGLNTACEVGPINRTSFGIPRNPHDSTLVSRRERVEIYVYCGQGVKLEDIKMAEVYSGEKADTLHLQNNQGYVQIIEKPHSGKLGIMGGTSLNSNNVHDVSLELYVPDDQDNPVLVDSFNRTLDC